MSDMQTEYRQALLAHDGSRQFLWEQTKVKPNCSVYFIHAPVVTAIKIGRAVDPFQRIRELQFLSPVPIRLLGYVAGDFALEEALHAEFAAERMHGEWFSVSVRLRARVDELLCGKLSRRLVEGWP